MNRREWLKGSLIGAAALASLPLLSWAKSAAGEGELFAALERRHGGKLSVAVHDLQSGRRWGHRADERVLMCSTCKLPIVAAVLHRVDQGKESLDRRVVFGQDVVLNYAPVTSKHVGGEGMTVRDICAAAIMVSDNTAGNLLLDSFGGPAQLTAFMRGIGDQVTRLDRNEPTLNVPSEDGLLDTTSPEAMTQSVGKLLFGEVLSAASREQLANWLRATTTGMAALRAGMPAAWQAGDKTGRNNTGQTNDVAVFWAPKRKPLIISAYYLNEAISGDGRDGVLAEVGRIVAGGVPV